MFKHIAYLLAIGAGLLGSLQLTANTIGGQHHCHHCPQCGASAQCCFQEVKVATCKMVADKKPVKKIVYEMREVPYCQKKITCGHCDCEQCRACANHKRVLVKREINCGDKCETKCVPEETTQLVPVPCCKCGYRGHCQ